MICRGLLTWSQSHYCVPSSSYGALASSMLPTEERARSAGFPSSIISCKDCSFLVSTAPFADGSFFGFCLLSLNSDLALHFVAHSAVSMLLMTPRQTQAMTFRFQDPHPILTRGSPVPHHLENSMHSCNDESCPACGSFAFQHGSSYACLHQKQKHGTLHHLELQAGWGGPRIFLHHRRSAK